MNLEKEIIERLNNNYCLNLTTDMKYYGGTIIKKIKNPNYTEVLYCEDGFVDENNEPYILETSFPNDIELKDRLIVFYKENGGRVILPIDNDSWNLVGLGIPENVQNIDYSKSKNIKNRETLKLKKEPTEVTEEEIKYLTKVAKSKYKTSRSILGGILLSILFFIIVGITTLFITVTLNDNVSEKAAMISLVLGILLIIILSIKSFSFFFNLPVKRIKKFKYKYEFLVSKINLEKNIQNNYSGTISGYNYNDNICKFGIYNIYSGELDLVKDVKPYDIIYMYTKYKYIGMYDDNLFIKKEIEESK